LPSLGGKRRQGWPTAARQPLGGVSAAVGQMQPPVFVPSAEGDLQGARDAIRTYLGAVAAGILGAGAAADALDTVTMYYVASPQGVAELRATAARLRQGGV